MSYQIFRDPVPRQANGNIPAPFSELWIRLWVSHFTGWTRGHRGRKCSPLTQRYLRSHIPGIPGQLLSVDRAGRSHLCHLLPSLCSFRWSHKALRSLSVLSNSQDHPDPWIRYLNQRCSTFLPALPSLSFQQSCRSHSSSLLETHPKVTGVRGHLFYWLQWASDQALTHHRQVSIYQKWYPAISCSQ